MDEEGSFPSGIISEFSDSQQPDRINTLSVAEFGDFLYLNTRYFELYHLGWSSFCYIFWQNTFLTQKFSVEIDNIFCKGALRIKHL